MRRGAMGAMMVLVLVLTGCGGAPEPEAEPKQSPPEGRSEEAPRPPAPTRAELT